LLKIVQNLSFSFLFLEKKKRNKRKFKANPMLRRLAILRLPLCNSVLFLLAGCAMRRLPLV
jgi:hypothetical protein